MSMQSVMVPVGGQKGGVGKSTVTQALAEIELMAGRRPYIIDGDAGIPDVAERYRGILDGLVVNLQRPDSAGEAVTDLFAELESVFQGREPRRVICNLPGGAADTIDAMAPDLIAPTLQALGVRLVSVIVLGPGEDSVRALEASLRGGLCSIADHCVAVANSFFGPPDRSAWWRSLVRSEWLEAGHAECVLPAMIPRVADRVRGLPGPMYQLASGETGGLAIVERAGLQAWLRACAPLSQAVFESV